MKDRKNIITDRCNRIHCDVTPIAGRNKVMWQITRNIRVGLHALDFIEGWSYSIKMICESRPGE